MPWRIVKPLFRNQIEFNYLEDNLILSDACSIADGCICIQKQKYKLLLVEKPDVLTRQLCEKLQSFIAGGGKVIVHNKHKCKLLLDGAIEIEDMDSIADEIVYITGGDIFISPSSSDLRVSHVIKGHLLFLPAG